MKSPSYSGYTRKNVSRISLSSFEPDIFSIVGNCSKYVSSAISFRFASFSALISFAVFFAFLNFEIYRFFFSFPRGNFIKMVTWLPLQPFLGSHFKKSANAVGITVSGFCFAAVVTSVAVAR